jgi:hypothetical protein
MSLHKLDAFAVLFSTVKKMFDLYNICQRCSLSQYVFEHEMSAFRVVIGKARDERVVLIAVQPLFANIISDQTQTTLPLTPAAWISMPSGHCQSD